MKHFLLALQFLTIFTLRPGLRCEAIDFLKARFWYGLVGFLLGLLMAAFAWLGQDMMPALPLSACLVLVWAGLTRCLHLDGLGDTADALIGMANKERALEIMKDPRVGSFGLVAVAGLLLIKFSALSALLWPSDWFVLLFAPIWGRLLALGLSLYLPAANSQGLGYMTTGRDISGFGGLILGLLLLLGISLLGAGLRVFFLLAAGQAILFMLLAMWFKRRLSGINGDTLGASIEIGEAVVLLTWLIIS